MSGRGGRGGYGNLPNLPPGAGKLMFGPTRPTFISQQRPPMTLGIPRSSGPPLRHQLNHSLYQQSSTASSCQGLQQSAAATGHVNPAQEYEEGSLAFLENVQQDTPFKNLGICSWQSGDSTPEAFVAKKSKPPGSIKRKLEEVETGHFENSERAGPSQTQDQMSKGEKKKTKQDKTINPPKASAGAKSSKKKKQLKKCGLCLDHVEDMEVHKRVYHKITQDICLKQKGHDEKKKKQVYTKMCYHCKKIHKKDYEVLICRASHGISKCQHCEMSAKDHYDVLEHIRKDHSIGTVEFPCFLPNCKRKKPIKEKCALLQHQRRDHNVGISRGGDKEVVTCDKCKKVFMSARNLKDHQNRAKPCKNGMDHPWCLPTAYDSKKPPFLTALPHKMNLHFTFSITEVSEINDLEQTLRIPMYFTVTWEDSRLLINEKHKSWAGNRSGPVGENTEEVETINALWKPSLEIYGLENFSTNTVLGEMAGLRVTKIKEIKYDIKTAITISCQMDFRNYPFDKHTCYFQVGSYFFDKDAVSCSSEYIVRNKTERRLLQHDIEYNELTDEKGTIQLRSGIYAACGFQIQLDRKHEPLIWQVYLPCTLFVIVSWISFIIDPLVIPGRMSLLVILLLVANNVFNQVKSTSPSAGSKSLNAIESYIVTCIFIIFSAIVEYAMILSIYTLRPPDMETSTTETTEHTENGQGRLYLLIRRPRLLDVTSLIAFSSCFLVFNINYWIISPYE